MFRISLFCAPGDAERGGVRGEVWPVFVVRKAWQGLRCASYVEKRASYAYGVDICGGRCNMVIDASCVCRGCDASLRNAIGIANVMCAKFSYK